MANTVLNTTFISLQSERHTEAHAAATAEREPLVGCVMLLQEALGAKRLRFGIQVFQAMDEVATRAQYDAGWVLATAGW